MVDVSGFCGRCIGRKRDYNELSEEMPTLNFNKVGGFSIIKLFIHIARSGTLFTYIDNNTVCRLWT